MKRLINLRGFLYLTVCRMELVKTEGLSKGWAGKWLKVDVSYKVWKVWPIFMVLQVDRAKLTKDRIVDAFSMVGRIIT